MYFKKLEITGFKSFAEKTVLNFEPGVTAVVGPNGCGKSNVIDAIKWVLGEQSVKTLRGAKMEDVIFNGTDKSEPLNMAEVSITLANTDAGLDIDSKNVTISRRLFRSGESEYLINKAPVRLKDVSELLMGTGIGMSAYSIIEQGKIGMIVSSKPEDRRVVFEEASGITKFKARKREAVRKLEATDENLVRVNDIINEVKRQINSITRQANKAGRYRERFERLKELEVKVADFERGAITSDLSVSASELEGTRSEAGTHEAHLEKLSRELAVQKQRLAEADELLGAIQSEKFSKEGTVEYCKNKIEMNRERIGELSARAESFGREIEALKKKTESAVASLTEMRRGFSEVSDDAEVKSEILRDNEARLTEMDARIRADEEAITANKLKIVECMSEHSKCKNELVRSTTDIQHRSVRLRRLSIEKEKVDEEWTGVNESVAAADESLEGLNSSISSLV